MAPEFVRPTPALLAELAQTMRPEDQAEAWLAAHLDPLAALIHSTGGYGPSAVVMAAGRPIAAFGVGVARPLSSTGHPWMLGSTHLEAYSRDFARQSRPIVRRMHEAFPCLVNWVLAANVVHVRWIRSCGFVLEPAAPFGVEGALFHRFTMP